MAFKGNPHLVGAGRKKGTPNKLTLDLVKICEDQGINPFSEMLTLVTHHNVFVKMAALKEVCRYLYPQRKAIEHSGEISNPYLQKSVDELEKLVKEKLGK